MLLPNKPDRQDHEPKTQILRLSSIWIFLKEYITTLFCQIQLPFKNIPSGKYDELDVKVHVNPYGKIMLEAYINGNRHRLSTRKKATLCLLIWYKCHAVPSFLKLYKKKYHPLPYQITFKEYGEYILESTRNYRNDFSHKEQLSKFNMLCETFGDIQLREIKTSHILIWQNSIDKEPKTIINYRSTLNMIFKYAVYDEIININPLSMIKAPKIAKKEVKVFTVKEIGLLVEHTSGQLKNIILLAAFTGIRAGELIALKWSDIDFRSKTITIARRTREGDEDVPKSKRIRVLDMLPQAKKALVEQMPLSKDKSEYIFLSRFDIPYKRSNKISASIRRMCKKLKIEEGTLQTQRRSCNTLYKQYGLPNDWILDQLGHIEEGVNRTHYTGRIKPNLSEIGKLLAE